MTKEERKNKNKNDIINAVCARNSSINYFSENQRRSLRKAGLAFQKHGNWFWSPLALQIQNTRKYDLAKEVVTYLLGYSQTENGFSYNSLLVYFILDRKGIDYTCISLIEDEMYDRLGLVKIQVESYLINLQECHHEIITVDLLGGLDNIYIKRNVDIW